MEWIDALEDTTLRFAEILASGDLDAPVPACPEWTLADLGDHLRYVHAWATHALVKGNPDGATPPVGPERDALVTGYREAAAGLVTALRRTAPDAPAWTFGTDQRAAFWQRRQAHEAAIHHFDALASQGRPDDWTIAPELAWDGVAEVAELWYPRQLELDRSAPLPVPLRLTATDLPGASLTLEPDADGRPVDLELPVVELLLTLWGRRPAVGEAAALLRTAPVTP